MIGQPQAVKILENSIKNDKIAQAYIFHGPEGSGKLYTAYLFAMGLNCYSSDERVPCGTCVSCRKFLKFAHPDILFLFPIPKFDINSSGEIKTQAQLNEYQSYIDHKISTPWHDYIFSSNTEIRIDQIRMIQQKLMTAPYEAEKKIIIIENVEKMNVQASNAFLKTLEEPSPNTIIIMTTQTINSILPTIQSRCQKIEFRSIKAAKIEVYLRHVFSIEPVKAKLIAKIANGNLEKAIRLAKEDNFESIDMTAKFFQIVISGDVIAYLAWMDEILSNYGKNSTFLNDVLNSFILFLNDIKSFQLCQNDIVNINQVKLIAMFYERNPYILEYLDELFFMIEDMQRALKGHVLPKLVFTHIYNTLSDCFNINNPQKSTF